MMIEKIKLKILCLQNYGPKLNVKYKFTCTKFVYLSYSGMGRFNLGIKGFPITPAIPVPISVIITLKLTE